MNKTIIIAGIVIVIVILGGILIANQQKQNSATKMQESKVMMHPSTQEKPTEVMKKDSTSSMKDNSINTHGTGTPETMKPSGTMMQKENSTGSSMMKDK